VCDGRLGFLFRACCISLISEFLEYSIDVKERDHAVEPDVMELL
jgi:hypothetical protein